MDSEEKLRQEAVQLFLANRSVSSIASKFSRSRQWVSRYKSNPDTDWYKDQSKAPKKTPKKLPKHIEYAILKVRKRLDSNPYSQKGAITILYELNRLGIEAPSVSTINRVLKRNGLIKKSKKAISKSKEYPTYYCNVQQMDLIGPRYLKGGFKFYIFTIIDKENHVAGVYPIPNKSARSIVSGVIDFWTVYQMPDYLQMDNELSFRGSNRYPRALGLLLRTAISNGVTPIFIPVAEPWRNGVIEKFNETVQTHFLSTHFASFEEMQLKAKEFSKFHNANHRYSSQNNKTPNELLKEIKYTTKLTHKIDLDKKLLIEEGEIIFIRFIRSNLKLNVLNSTFTVAKELIYSYVEAIIVIDKHLLVVKHKNVVYHYFEFVMPLS